MLFYVESLIYLNFSVYNIYKNVAGSTNPFLFYHNNKTVGIITHQATGATAAPSGYPGGVFNGAAVVMVLAAVSEQNLINAFILIINKSNPNIC